MFRTTFKELRLQRAMSQKQLARELNCSQSTVGYWESGERIPSFDKLQSIANYFGVTVDYLLGREEERDPTKLDDFSYALFNETKDLTEEDKQQLMDMAKFLRMRKIIKND